MTESLIVMTQDRLGEGTLYAVDTDAMSVRQVRTFSPYRWNETDEMAPESVPATDKNPNDASDFLPSIAVTQGYCPGVGGCIIRVTRTGQIEYAPIGT